MQQKRRRAKIKLNHDNEKRGKKSKKTSGGKLENEGAALINVWSATVSLLGSRSSNAPRARTENAKSSRNVAVEALLDMRGARAGIPFAATRCSLRNCSRGMDGNDGQSK